jgi:DNA-binding Lrp family transcriptional regulator
MYESGSTQTEIAEALGVSQKVVWRFMKNNGIKSRVAAKRDQRGEKNSCWKGGMRINEQGYVEIYMPNYAHTRPNGYVREHIYVAEQMIGRRLLFFGVGDQRNEVVHHIDGNKQNNAPYNLLILTQKEHMKLHKATSKEIIDCILLKRIRQLENELAIKEGKRWQKEECSQKQ